MVKLSVLKFLGVAVIILGVFSIIKTCSEILTIDSFFWGKLAGGAIFIILGILLLKKRTKKI